LLLQVAGAVASLSTPSKGIGMGLDDEETTTKSKGPVMYISGEENAWQIANRAYRLGIDQSELFLLCDTDADTIAEMVANPKKGTKLPSLVVIDSIQTMVRNLFQLRLKVEEILFHFFFYLHLDDREWRILISGWGNTSEYKMRLCNIFDIYIGNSSDLHEKVRESVALFLRLAKSTGIPIVLVGHVTKSGDVAGPK